MDDEATSAPDDEPGADGASAVIDPPAGPAADGAPATDEEADPGLAPPEEASPAAEIIDLPWDDDLPVALGDDGELEVGDEVASETGSDGAMADDDESTGDGAPDRTSDDAADRSDAYFAERRRLAARSVSSWRNRSATGAIATAIAMGLQQVFEPEKRRPAAVAEAPSDPYDDDDPVTVEYVPDDAEATTVRVKPWLLQKGDPS